MDKYDKIQIEEIKERFIKEKTNRTVNNWDQLYTEMRKDLEELKEQNKLQDERIRVMAILECAEQKKVNIAVEKALPLVSLILSTSTGMLSTYYSNNLVQILQEKLIDNVMQEELVNNLTQEEFTNNVLQIETLLTSFFAIFFMLIVILGAIAIVYYSCMYFCKRRQNDIVYYQTRLNIIDMLLAEDTKK